MSKNIIYDRYFQVSAALLVTDGLVYSLVDPTKASALWLITGFALLGLSMLSLAALLAQSVKTYGEQAHRIAWRILRYGVVAAVILIGLQSIGQLTTKDILTFAPFVITAYWYFGYSKRTASRMT
jgi:hypothetical protein